MVVRIVEISARGYKTLKKRPLKVLNRIVFLFRLLFTFFYNINNGFIFFRFAATTLFQKIQIIKLSIAKRQEFLRSSFCKIS